MYTASLKRSENYKAQPYQYASPSKQILKVKAKPLPPCTHYGFNDHRPDDYRNYHECGIYGSYDHYTSRHNRAIHIKGGVLVESSQSSESSISVKCNTCGSIVHSTTDHNEFDHFKRGEKIQATKAREPTKNGCSRSMTGVKSYLHKYVEQPGPKVVFGDNSSCIAEGYGSINCGGIIFTKVAFVNGIKYNLISISQLCDVKYIIQFDDKQGTIFNANKEIVLIAPRRNDVYVLDMSSLTLNRACFFAEASESINCLWHKRLSHLNFKNINKLAKQNKVLGLPLLVYSKDKPCLACEKGKHHRASFKTKQNFSIRKCLHFLHMDLFRPVSPMSINHEKYTLVIIDEYSRTDNGTECRNHELKSFCDEKGISQNFSSPYTPEQNGVAERKNNTLIEAARTMLNGSVPSKHFWTEAVRIACYTQNRSIIVKRHDKTLYEIFRERIPDINYFHVFGCPVFIHNHKDHLGKFDAKADDGYFLGYSFVSKAFKVFNTRRQQIEETYHVTFDEMIALNETDIPLTEDIEGPYDLINTEGTHNQNVQNEQITTQPTEGPSGNNTKVLVSINESLVPDALQSHISNQASTSMLTKSMAAKLTDASTSECLFADFLSKIEPKKVFEALKHPGWVDAMQEELNHLFRNKVWTLVPLPYGKIAIGSKWVFRNNKDEHGITTKNKARLVAQGYSQEEGIDYDETFAPVYVDDIIFGSTSYKLCKQFEKLMTKKFEMRMMEKLTYFLGLQIKQDDKGISISQEQYTRNLLKKYEISNCSSLKTPMVPPNNLGPDLTGKYQSNPKESHITVVKRILKYLKDTPTLGEPSYERESDVQPLVLSTYEDVRAFLLSDDEAHESEEDILGAGEEAYKPQSSIALSTEASDTDSSSDDILRKYNDTLPLTKRKLVKYLRKVSTVLFNRITEDHWEKHEEAAVHYANLKASIDDYYDENIAHRDQTDKMVEASMSSLDKIRTATSHLYKGMNIITDLLKDINNAVKDDLTMNKKISEATETFTKIFTNITEARALKQEEELAAWAKSSTNMAWILGSRLSANVEGENETNTATKDPPSYTKGETDANKQEKPEEPKHSTDANIEFIGSSTPQPSITQAQPITIINPEPIVPQREGKGIATDEHTEDQRKLVKASFIVRPDPDAPVLVLYTINRKFHYLIAEQIKAHMDKEEKIKKAKEEARLLAINKTEVIKVVREEAKKLGIHP
ncbi:retrovirus-related pol polyprotein from transposon TNT 1-94, partial [Tanacetum coccineum]